MKNIPQLFLSFLFLSSSAHAVISLTAPSSDTDFWVGISYMNTSDPANDAQTSNGGGEADLIGGFYDPDGAGPDPGQEYFALYKGFDFGANPGGETVMDLDGDETIAFRARVGGDDNPPGFGTGFWLGIDLGGTGAFDYFIGIFNSNSNDDLALYQFTTPATNLSDTKKANYQQIAWAGTIADLDLSAGTGSDPFSLGSSVGDPVDIDGFGNPDYLVQVELDFSDLAAAMGLTQEQFFETQISFGLWTSQNLNQVNNDVNGLGVYSGDPSLTPSLVYTPSGELPVVPEPSTYGLLLDLCAVGILAKRRGGIYDARRS